MVIPKGLTLGGGFTFLYGNYLKAPFLGDSQDADCLYEK